MPSTDSLFTLAVHPGSGRIATSCSCPVLSPGSGWGEGQADDLGSQSESSLLREVEDGQVGAWASWKQMDISSLASFPGEVSMWSGFSLEILAEWLHPAEAD